MTRRPLQFVALVALAACQVGEPTGPSKVDPPPSLAIQDGAHSAGNPDFFFLLPLVLPTSSYSNWTHDGFNRSLSPSVEICRLVATTAAQVATVAGSACRATPAPVIIEGTDVKKHFPPAADPSDVLTGLPGDWAHYHAKWPIPNNCNNTFFYRVRARVGSVELGFADVQCVTNLLQLLLLDYRKFGAAPKGKVLQIPFRIERYALCETPGVGPCGTASVTLTEESVTELQDPETGIVIGSVTIPVQDEPSTPDPVVVNVEGCDDLRDRVVSPLDLPTFGPCLRITTDPEIELSNAATVFICTIAGTSGGQNIGTVSEDQEHRITIHRRDELPTPSVHALPHVPGCAVATASTDRSLKGFFAALTQGRWKDAGGRLLNIMGPTPLYARRFIDVGGGGFSLEFSDFQLALPGSLTITGGDAQTGEPGVVLPIPAEVTVVDVGGEAVGGARVRFKASVDGEPDPEIVVPTAANGKAITSWTLSSTAGPNTLVARGFGLGGTDFSGPRATVDPFQSIQPPFDPGPSVPPLQEVPLAVGSVTFNANGAALYGSAYSGTTGPASLYAIDPGTGTATLIGAIGFNRVGAMDFHPTTGVLYATGQRPSTNVPVLITIDVTTGAGTEVGPTGINGTIADVAFRSDGTLFVYDAIASDHTLYTANLSTGVAIIVGSTGLTSNGGNGIVFDNLGELRHSNRDSSHTLNQTTGVATPVAGMTFQAGCTSTGAARVAASARKVATNVLYGAIQCDAGEYLGTVNYATGAVTLIGPTVSGLDGLAQRN